MSANQAMQPSGEVGRFEVDDQPSPPADRNRYAKLIMRRIVSRHGSSSFNFMAGVTLSALATGLALFLLAFAVQGLLQEKFSLPLNAERGWSWFAIAITGLNVILVAYIAHFLWRVTFALRTHCVTVYSGGLGLYEEFSERFVSWSEVETVVEVSVREAIPILNPPFHLLLPRWQSKRYEIWICNEDTPYCYDKNGVSDLKRFRDLLFNACETHSIPIRTRVEHCA